MSSNLTTRPAGTGVLTGVLIGVLVVLGVALAGPEWVPHSLTREDGPIEFASFAGFVVASGCAFWAAHRLRDERRLALAAVALGAVLFVAAGEEISWGQRLLGLETPELLVDGNRQDELNLHNLDGLQDKAVFAQLAVALAGAMLPLVDHRRWARVGFPFFVAYLAYRGGRGLAAVAGIGPADRNSEVAELVLAFGLLVLSAQLLRDARTRPDRRIDRRPGSPTATALGGPARRGP